MATKPDIARLLDRAQDELRHGRADAAEEICRKAIARAGGAAEPYCLGARIASVRGFPDVALDRWRKALAIDPDHAAALDGLGNHALDAGDRATAIDAFRRLAAVLPDRFEGHYNLGSALLEAGEIEPAIASFRAALARNPGFADAHNNLGLALRGRGDLPGAIAAFAAAVRLVPDEPEFLGNLASARYEAGESGPAIDLYRRALAIRPDDPTLHCNLGIALHAIGDPSAALASFDRAIARDPANAEAHYARALALEELGRPEEAVEANLGALAADPDHGKAIAARVDHLTSYCAWEELPEAEARLADETGRAIAEGRASGETPFLNSKLSAEPVRNLAVARIWSRDLARRAAAMGVVFDHGDRCRRDQRLRIGYISYDIRNHAIAHLTAGLFEAHDRARFEVSVYSIGPADDSPWRRRIVAAAEHFVDCRTEGIVETARRIVADRIDILVDLTGHTKGGRPLVLALRPAPVQVWWLGFAGTSGADFYDYIVVDPVTVPHGHDRHFTEALVRLPYTYQVNDSKQAIAPSTPARAAHGLPETGIVFCSFNQTYKIERVMFAAWMRILSRVPGSVLWLLRSNRIAETNLRRQAEAHGVAPDRLVFAPFATKADHLARVAQADLGLDTRVINGHTTTADTLWAGVPVLTLAGAFFPSRVAASLVSAMGLPKLAVDTLEDYEETAVRLASDRDALARLRDRVARNRTTTPLFDTTGFTGNLETAFTRMWDRYVDGLAPAPIDIPGAPIVAE